MTRRPPPPPRRGLPAPEKLRRIRARHEHEEKPFDPARSFPRATRPHHFMLNGRKGMASALRRSAGGGEELVTVPAEFFFDGRLAVVVDDEPGRRRWEKYHLLHQPSGYSLTIGMIDSKGKLVKALRGLEKRPLPRQLAAAMPRGPEAAKDIGTDQLRSLVSVANAFGPDSDEVDFVESQIRSGDRFVASWHDVEKKMARNGRHRRNHGGITQLYAQPYSPEGTGFYMESSDDWNKGLKKSRHEEFEIQFIDGPDYLADLFKALDIQQGAVERWFDELEHLDEEYAARLYYLAENGYDLDEAMDKSEELSLIPGTVEEWAENLIEDIGPENVNSPEFYFDYEAFGRDIRINGEDTMHLEEDLRDAEDEEDEERVEEIREEIARIESLSEEELGEEIIENGGGLSELGKGTIQMYFDIEKFARDAELGGDIDEFTFGGVTYVAEPNSV